MNKVRFAGVLTAITVGGITSIVGVCDDALQINASQFIVSNGTCTTHSKISQADAYKSFMAICVGEQPTITIERENSYIAEVQSEFVDDCIISGNTQENCDAIVNNDASKKIIKSVIKTKTKTKTKPVSKPTVRTDNDLIVPVESINTDDIAHYGNWWSRILIEGHTVWVVGFDPNMIPIIEYISTIHPNADLKNLVVMTVLPAEILSKKGYASIGNDIHLLSFDSDVEMDNYLSTNRK